MKSFIHRSLIAGCSALLVACSDSTTSYEPEPDITSITVPALVVPYGFSATTIVSVIRGSTFTGEVTLTAENVPAGVQVSFNPATLAGNASNTVMTVVATVASAKGSHSFRVRAGGVGVEPLTATTSISVEEPSFEVNLGAPNAQVEQGENITIPITVTRSGGYTNAVDLNLSGVPVNVSGTITPSRLQSGQSSATLTLSASLLATVSTPTITVRASALGLPQKTAELSVAIVPATKPAVLIAADEIIEGERGAFRTHAVTVTRFGSFTGDVTVRLINAPGSVTSDPLVIPAGQTIGALSFGVPISVAEGTTNVILRAEGAGVTTYDLPARLRVSTVRAFAFLFRDVPPIGLPTTAPEYFAPRGSTVSMNLQTIRFVDTEIHLSTENLPDNWVLSMPSILPAAPEEQFTTLNLSIPPNAPPGRTTFRIWLMSPTTGYQFPANIGITVQQ